MKIIQRIKAWLGRVDIWSHQRHLMAISDQRLPEKPTLTSESILYVALTAEELGETCRAMVAAIDEHMGSEHPGVAHTWAMYDPRLYSLRNYLDMVGQRWQDNAVTIRKLLAEAKMRDIPLAGDAAVDIADGIADATVTIAGAALASGMPGDRVYAEVQHSNASKANPDTGKIDKTPDGKWIKGRDYTPADIAAVLEGFSS